MSTALEIVSRARALDARLVLQGDNLELDIPIDFPEEIIDLLRVNKPQVLDYLRSEDTETTSFTGSCQPCWCPEYVIRVHVSCAGCRGSVCSTCVGCMRLRRELSEIVRRVDEEGVVLVSSTILEDDMVAFVRSDHDLEKVPPGFTPYTVEELGHLFSQGKDAPSPIQLRLSHEAKKMGGWIIEAGEA